MTNDHQRKAQYYDKELKIICKSNNEKIRSFAMYINLHDYLYYQYYNTVSFYNGKLAEDCF